MKRRFDLTRHRDIKDRLIVQLRTAQSDTRIISIGMRMWILAMRLRKMNESNGLTGRPIIQKPTLDVIKTYQSKLRGE